MRNNKLRKVSKCGERRKVIYGENEEGERKVANRNRDKRKNGKRKWQSTRMVISQTFILELLNCIHSYRIS
jgi:hypothetical protein